MAEREPACVREGHSPFLGRRVSVDYTCKCGEWRVTGGICADCGEKIRPAHPECGNRQIGWTNEGVQR
jgi:hypothetical protein